MRGLLLLHVAIFRFHERMVTLKNPCPVCGERRSLNREDVLPGWVRRALARMGTPNRRYPFRICRECNSQLGKDFEDAAAPIMAPMLEGARVVLSPKEQRIVAAWILKTAFLVEYSQWILRDSHRAEALRMLLLQVMETRLPPPYSSVRIAAVSAERSPPSPPPKPAASSLFGLMGPVPGTGHCSQTVIGFLAIQTFTSDLASITALKSGAKDNDWFIDIWPPIPEPAVWPPANSLRSAEWQELAEGVFEARRVSTPATMFSVPRKAPPVPERAKPRKRHIRLSVAADIVPSEHTILRLAVQGLGFQHGGEGGAPLTWHCGRCDKPLTDGIGVGRISGLLLQCGKCQTLNWPPEFGKFPEADAVSGIDTLPES